ncbi:MAG: tRNA (adenosine(37)-N6)-dimethylallyltransferase MiaA [Lachnospiraceae bacterium]|nr:tRNA (adenosine(37)-N6)-dimethylallyltransferase MiaA [Lachnospiraceae bacterium]
MKKPLVIITGPTAVGKTELSIELAKKINGEIISADSVQVYKHMDIGSAKISKAEMQDIPHYLIDILEPDESFNIALFQELCCKAMDEIYSRRKIPIIVGGTGFYIQSVVYDISFDDTTGDDIRKKYERLHEEKGADYIHGLLKDVDPKSADSIHPNNYKRVIRALEYYEQTGKKISEHNETQRENVSPYNFAYFVLNCDRKLLYDRIERRVDLMLEVGLIDEVKHLKEKYSVNRQMVSMQALGYKEILDYLEGEISLERAIYLIKRDTRHFAKRQLTWFRREKEVTWVDKDILSNAEDQLTFMLQQLSDKHII